VGRAADDAPRYAARVIPIDPRYRRIASRLTTAELRRDDDADVFDDSHGAFLDTYSANGLAHALAEYGVTAALAERGLADHQLVITREDPFRHRLQVLLLDGSTQIMDLRLHLQEQPRIDAAVVVVEWLMLQNPRASFTTSRPRLPGQERPGTGLGGLVHQLLVLLCRRLGREALQNTPEHFHLALLYRRAGYVDIDDDGSVDAVVAAGKAAGLGFAALAWAVERGHVHIVGDGAWKFEPRPMFCPVSSRLAQTLSVRRRRADDSVVAFVVDVPGLVRSLTAEPVAGLDASRLTA